MAKNEVTFACGHTETVTLFGPKDERQKRIEWLAQNGTCTQCWKAAKPKATRAIGIEELTYDTIKLIDGEFAKHGLVTDRWGLWCKPGCGGFGHWIRIGERIFPDGKTVMAIQVGIDGAPRIVDPRDNKKNKLKVAREAIARLDEVCDGHCLERNTYRGMQ